MSRLPKHMLIELPTADEIDALAMTTPRFEVRKFEFDLKGQKADLKYSPCKGQMILVIAGKKGIAFVPGPEANGWTLPSGRIGTNEDTLASAKRIAREQCGLSVRGLELAGIYDVVWHYVDFSIKRLHLVYCAITEDDECSGEKGHHRGEARFFTKIPEAALRQELVTCALADCSGK